MQPIDLSSELPPRRDDEPSSLRADIFDELLDHLECSYQRERVKTSDETIAQRNVLAKFGNPASIAFRLWRDAMWEKLVMQRITKAAVGSVIAVAVIASFIMWQSAAAAQRRLLLQVGEQQTMFSALLDRLSQPADSVPDELPGWESVTVKLIGENGEPAQGSVGASLVLPSPAPRVAAPDSFDARIQQLAGATRWSMRATTDAQGFARLGNLPYGTYDLRFTVTVGGSNAFGQRRINVRENVSTFEFHCPTQPVPRHEVVFRMQPPPDLQYAPIQYVGYMRAGDEIKVDDRIWELPNEGFWLLDAKGQMVGRMEPRGRASANRLGWDMDQVIADEHPTLACHQAWAVLSICVKMPVDNVLRTARPQELSDYPQGDVLLVQRREVFLSANANGVDILTPDSQGRLVLDVPADHPFWDRVRAFLAKPQIMQRAGRFENGLLIID